MTQKGLILIFIVPWHLLTLFVLHWEWYTIIYYSQCKTSQLCVSVDGNSITMCILRTEYMLMCIKKTTCACANFSGFSSVGVHMFMCSYFPVCVGVLLCLWALAKRGSSKLTRTKLAGNHPSSSSIWPHHQSLLEASSTLMTSPALNANSRSAMVTWSHTASAFTIEPPLIN